MTTSRTRLMAAAALVVVLAAATLLAISAGSKVEGPTTSSRFGAGLRGAYRYLQLRGAEPENWDRSLDSLPREPGLLIIALPLNVPFTRGDAQALEDWLLRGGNLLLLGSGRELSPFEWSLIHGLSLSVEASRGAPPWRYAAWRAWVSRRQELHPPDGEAAPADGPPVRELMGTHAIARPGDARDLLLDEDGTPALFEFRRGKGRVTVFNNVSAFSNALLAEGGNLELLEGLAHRLRPEGGRLLFDEWHHGHRAAAALAKSHLVSPAALLLAHAALLYFLALWTLGRRFGPVITPAGPAAGSVGRRLMSIASLHRASHHASHAGNVLLESVRRLARRREDVTQAIPRHFYGGDDEFLELARTVGQWQKDKSL